MPKKRKARNESSKVIAYVRVSTDEQDLSNQKCSIYEWGRKNKIQIDEMIEATMSSRKGHKARKLDVLLEMLGSGDTLVVAELSRLGRSISEIIRLIDDLAHKHIRVICLKESLDISTNDMDIKNKMLVMLLGLFAEIERELISERTKAGLAAAKKKGKLLGRPKGRSKLDVHEAQIYEWLQMGVTQVRIAQNLKCTEPTLSNWLKTKRKEQKNRNATRQ